MMKTHSYESLLPLGEGAFGDRAHQLSHPAAPFFAPNHCPVAADSAAGRQGVRSTTEGEKGRSARAELAPDRAIQVFSCHGAGKAAGGQGHTQFNPIDFYAKTGSLVLSRLKKAPFPSSPPPSSPTKQQPHASSLRHAAVFLQKTLS